MEKLVLPQAQNKNKFYKSKAFVIPVVAMMAFALVAAAVVYFHSTPVSLTVDEARSSADIPLTLSGYSGETINATVTIHNAANVPLRASLSYVEDSNENNVTYVANNLPVDIDLAPLADTSYYPSFTFDNITEPGTVNITINYQKIA